MAYSWPRKRRASAAQPTRCMAVRRNRSTTWPIGGSSRLSSRIREDPRTLSQPIPLLGESGRLVDRGSPAGRADRYFPSIGRIALVLHRASTVPRLGTRVPDLGRSTRTRQVGQAAHARYQSMPDAASEGWLVLVAGRGVGRALGVSPVRLTPRGRPRSRLDATQPAYPIGLM